MAIEANKASVTILSHLPTSNHRSLRRKATKAEYHFHSLLIHNRFSKSRKVWFIFMRRWVQRLRWIIKLISSLIRLTSSP